MKAKDYLSGVFLDTKKFSKLETIKLMEEYHDYRIEFEKQEQVKNTVVLPDVINCGDRDILATDIIKIHVTKQIKQRRMSPMSRIKYWLNIKGWRVDYDLNSDDIIQKSYELADQIIKKRA